MIFGHLEALEQHRHTVEDAITEEITKHEEALRLLCSIPGIDVTAAAAIIADMPDWVPGTVNGTPARMRQVVRVPMEDSVYMVVEEMPKFPEGDVTRWIAEHMEYSPIGCGVSGKVFVKFVVEKDGRITNAQVLRPEDPVLDKEAIRLVESMPRWIPGKQDGKPVRVSYVVPVNFQLQ